MVWFKIVVKMRFFIIVASLYFMSSPGVTAYKQECPAEARKPWSYVFDLPNGIKRWSQRYPQCRGRSQSPINIQTNKVKIYSSLSKLDLFNYDKPVTQSTMQNDGYTVSVTPRDGVRRGVRINGDLYNLNQFHFHWGDRKSKGSEHKVNSKQYSMEIHFVHTNARGRTAVVGAFFEEFHGDSLGLLPITSELSQIPYQDDSVNIDTEIYLDEIIDDGCSFFRYNGSLTTPECTENVIWTICRDVHPIGHNQMAAFRKLYSVRYQDTNTNGCVSKLSNNFRPIQPLNGRMVISSAYF